MPKYREFHFTGYSFDVDTSTLRMGYAYLDGPCFEETVQFPRRNTPLSESELAALDLAFRLVYLVSGVSYYKAYVAPVLRSLAFPLDHETCAFLDKTYRNGLAEFAYRNQIDLAFEFVADTKNFSQAPTLNLPSRTLVPIGGGKDSVVTLETLKAAGKSVSLFAMSSASGMAKPIQKCAEVSGLPCVEIQRTLCPRLFEINREGALNGHVPVTAILSSIATACAILHGFDRIAMSNERSANAPNICTDDKAINHQYSKSLDFERDFSSYVRSHVTPSLGYFSLLRPLSEIAIARRFSRHEKYFDVFRSCNASFRQMENERLNNWCCDCPKCRFVFLALAPFVRKEKLIEFFGVNLLNETSQIDGYKELCGLQSHKPFECVGEIEESTLTLLHLNHMTAWTSDCVVRELAPILNNQWTDHEARYNALFDLHLDHCVPPDLFELLHEAG